MKVSFLEPLGIPQERLESIIKAAAPAAECVYWPDRNTDEDELVRRVGGAEIAVLSNFKFGRGVIERCKELKMICVAFTGVDHVDVECCRERGITVCNCAGYSTSAVADLVFGFAVMLARNVRETEERCRLGGVKDGLVGFELEGKRFGVVGTGAIGSRVAKIAGAFGCEVVAYSRTKKEIDGVANVSLEELLKTSDIVSLHVPLTDQTRGMIGEREIAIMKPSAYLINTARGPVIDGHALASALKDGVIAGAAVDVYDIEPPLPRDTELLTAPNAICTPHIAFASHQAFEKRAVIVGGNIAAWIAGSPQNVVK